MKSSVILIIFIFIGKVHSDDDDDDEKEIKAKINYDSCGQNFPNNIPPGVGTNVGETPWIALVGREDEERKIISYACTGALINARYVLTTAHCILYKRAGLPNRVTHVRLGEQNIQNREDCFRTRLHPCVIKTKPLDLEIEEAIPHPNFNIGEIQSDNIGLIRLEETIDLPRYYGFINPICLPSPNMNGRIYFQNRLAEVVGWDFGSGHPNDIIMKEFLSLAKDSDCSKLYRGYNSETQICMQSIETRTRCIGDSGSPLSLTGPSGPPYLLVGILSFGPIPCRNSKTPTVFTSVSYYRDWIDKSMRPYKLL